MTRPVILDGMRTYLGASVPTPRGVNRVDHVYARHFLEHWPAEVQALMPTPWGMRLFSRDLARRHVAYLQHIWRERAPEGNDPAYDYFRARLLGGAAAEPESGEAGARRRLSLLGGVMRNLSANGIHFGAPAARAALRNAVYVNVGQVCWAAPTSTRWLARRPDVKAVFMLHDVIPLERPDFVAPISRMEMRWMLNVVIRRAHGLLTTTEAASEAVLTMLRAQSLPPIPVCPLHLPVDEAFRQPGPPDPALTGHPYFLVCGAIEPRKNTLLLLNLWEKLAARLGSATPRLVLAGTLEGNGAPILRQMLDSPALRPHLIMVSGVGTPRLRQMMVDAQALLMPSFAEGFGLPVVEALTVGTPVLASDIPAHREIGGGFAEYLDPHDEAGWLAAVMRLIEEPEWRAALHQRVAGYRPMTEADYFDRIREFLERL